MATFFRAYAPDYLTFLQIIHAPTDILSCHAKPFSYGRLRNRWRFNDAFNNAQFSRTDSFSNLFSNLFEIFSNLFSNLFGIFSNLCNISDYAKLFRRYAELCNRFLGPVRECDTELAVSTLHKSSLVAPSTKTASMLPPVDLRWHSAISDGVI